MVMAGLLQSFRRNWDAALAYTLAYVAIGLILGPGYFFLVAFLHLCATLIHQALKV